MIQPRLDTFSISFQTSLKTSLSQARVPQATCWCGWYCVWTLRFRSNLLYSIFSLQRNRAAFEEDIFTAHALDLRQLHTYVLDEATHQKSLGRRYNHHFGCSFPRSHLIFTPSDVQQLAALGVQAFTLHHYVHRSAVAYHFACLQLLFGRRDLQSVVVRLLQASQVPRRTSSEIRRVISSRSSCYLFSSSPGRRARNSTALHFGPLVLFRVFASQNATLHIQL